VFERWYPTVNTEEIKDKLKNAKKDYLYITQRNSRGKVDEKTFKYLKDTGVGGVFGAKTWVDEVFKKYGFDEKEKFGFDYDTCGIKSVEEFRKKYIEYLSKGKRLLAESYCKNNIDLTQPDFVERDTFYRNIIKQICKDSENVFITEDIKMAIDKAIGSLTPNQKKVIERRLGNYNDKLKSYDAIAKEMGLSHTRIPQLEAHAIRKLKSFKYLDNIRKKVEECRIDEDTRKEFFDEYFKYQDIFLNSDKKELPDDVRDKLIDIFEKGRVKRKEIFNNIKRFSRLSKQTKLDILEELFGEEIKITHISAENLDGSIDTYEETIKVEKLVDYPKYNLIHIKPIEQAFSEERAIQLVNENADEYGVEYEDEKDDLLDMPIYEIDRYHYYGGETIGDLIKLTTDELRKKYDSKRRTILLTRVHLLGLKFADEIEEKEVPEESIEQEKQAKDIRVADLDLSIRAYNCLTRGGINTMEDLTQRTHEELMKVRNMGNKSFAEVVDKIHSMGYKLADEVEEKEVPEESIGQENQVEETIYISELDLSRRASNCLIRGGINTMEDITQRTQDDLMRVRNMGKKSYEEIINKVHSLGYKLADEVEEKDDDKLKDLLNQLKEKYQMREQEKQKNQLVQAQLEQEIERIKNEKLSSTQRIEKLQALIIENGEFLAEIGELETLKQKIIKEQEEIAKKEQEEKEVKEKLQTAKEEEKVIDEDMEEIKKDVKDITD
jgi:hypothetical protein